MARLPRLEAAGYPHHVVQRGNNRATIFEDALDFTRYLTLLREVIADSNLALHAYVLMPDHAHLLVTPHSSGVLGRTMQALGRRYVRWFNDRHGRSGTLWEGRYRSAVLDADRYLLACMRYMEVNPVRSGLVATPDAYRWSSFAHHVGLSIDPLITDHGLFWALGNTPFERQSAYRRLFDEHVPEELVSDIRWATRRGWALTTIGRPGETDGPAGESWARPRPRGRPKAGTN